LLPSAQPESLGASMPQLERLRAISAVLNHAGTKASISFAIRINGLGGAMLVLP